MDKSRIFKVLHHNTGAWLLLPGLLLPTAVHADLPAQRKLADNTAGAPAAPAAKPAYPDASQEADPGTGFMKAGYAPASVTPETDTPDLWQRVRRGFTLGELDSPLVETHVSWYSQRPEYVTRTLERGRRYLFHIMEQVEKRGMPAEIALLPMVESAFNPMAYSRSHASGIWQFIPSTGKHYGLKQNGWYDGRRDIIAATSAALDYLDKLHRMFGTWELALAAYNCGEGCVSRAIAKNQAQGLPTDYLSLSLPTETRHYVPKLLAVKRIVSDPGMAGLNLGSIPNQAYFTPVTVQKPIDVTLAAKLANVPLNEFVSLNPAYNKPVVRSDSPRQLLLPVDKADVFASNLESYDRPLVSWQVYPAQKGEHADAIARKFGVTVAWLQQHNDLKLAKKGRLAASQALMVPLKGNPDTAFAAADSMDAPAAPDMRKKDANGVQPAITVRKGDTLFSLARQHGVSVADIKRWNQLRSDEVGIGRQLVVTAADTVQPEKPASKQKQDESAGRAAKSSAAKVKHYTVKRGDTLYSIARKFEVDVEDIQRWNAMKRHSTIQPGTRLTLRAG